MPRTSRSGPWIAGYRAGLRRAAEYVTTALPVDPTQRAQITARIRTLDPVPAANTDREPKED